MPTIAQLQNKLNWSRKQTSYAWAKYYEACNSQHSAQVSEHNLLFNVSNANTSLPQHLINEIHARQNEIIERIN